MTASTLELTQSLVRCASITPLDAGAQALLQERLKAMGFTIKLYPQADVSNFVAILGDRGPCLAFAGHTDVVPPGDLNAWTFPPFEPTVHEGKLYGRGVADMKGCIAAMITAAERFVARQQPLKGQLAFIITSDEEGPALHGTRHVIESLQKEGFKIDWCVVGEPSSVNTLGDTIKVGRRGSLTGHLDIIGIQGHIAYPQLALNPILQALPALVALRDTVWDQGNEDFQPTSWQISNIHSGTGVGNVIPGHLNVQFNFRYSPESTAEHLMKTLENTLKTHELNYKIRWEHGGLPFYSKSGTLKQAAIASIEAHTGLTPEVSTTGGTSDGRFIAPMGVEVIECGLLNRTIHQIDECTPVEDLEKLSAIYEGIMDRCL